MNRILPSILWLSLVGPWPSPAPADDGRTASNPADGGPSREEYRTRRRALMDQVKEAEAGQGAMRAALIAAGAGADPAPGAAGVVVVLVGAGEPGEDARFHQDNDFFYLTGVDVPHA